jgi:hypothetical protein
VRRLLFAIAFVPGFAYSLTLSDIETQIRRNVGDTATDPALQSYSDTLLDSIINEGQRAVVNATWAIEASSETTLTAGTTYYSLATNVIAVKKVRFRTAAKVTSEVEPTTETNLLKNNPDFERQSGKPVQFFTRISTRSAAATEIAYIPVPTTASTGTVTVTYYAIATDLSSDSDIPFNSLSGLYPYHDSLVFYATWRIKMIEHRSDEAGVYLGLYQSRVEELNQKNNKIPNFQIDFRGLPGVGR